MSICLMFVLYPTFLFAAVTVSVAPTTESVLTGSVRSVYSNVQGDANVGVTWSASGGALVNSVGFTTWTAPATPGTYTVTATSVADVTKTAITTFTVVSATVRVSNIPAQATIFKNQPMIIQSILWGNTNSAVTWSSSGGTLYGTGREVVFKTNVAGTYTVTSTSVADNTKSATTTIVVTNNAWPGLATPNKTMPIDCTATGSGTTYNVTTEAGMDAVPWSTLGAGDTVRIHAGTYHKQLLISTSGTNSQPIRICGVPDATTGALPELNGANATAKAGSLYGSGLGDMQIYGGITIYNWGAAYYGSTPPQNIIIEGLKISGFNSGNTFTDLSTGLVTSYANGAAPIRVQRGGNITIRGNELSNNGNGLFTMSKDGVSSAMTKNLLVEGNYFSGNGVVASYLEHQSYLQAFGLVVQGNYYAAKRAGDLGGQLKTRSVQQFVRYNYFKPAARMIDLVEEQDDLPLVFPWYGLAADELPYTSTTDVIANSEAYQNQFIYGNILHNAGPSVTGWMVHGGADTSSQDYNYGGTVYFYHNTIFDGVASNQIFRSGIFDFGPYQTVVSTHTTWPTARMTNNAVYLDTTTAPGLTTFFVNRYKSDRVILDKNWFSTAWGSGNTAGGDGTGIATAAGDGGAAATWQGGTLATQVSGIANLVTGSSIPFNTTSYVPPAGSPLLNASVPLTGLAASLPPLMQYSPVSYLMSIRGDILDIGALGVDQTPPVISVRSPINSTSAPISGNVSDNSGVASVTLQLAGSQQLIAATISDNSWTATVPGLIEGSNSITAVAIDIFGNTSTTTLTVVVVPTTPNPAATATATTTTAASGGKGGCFIATAAYGSYLHPQVQVLRNFRDNYLLTNNPGRALVALYYHYSPPIADFIAQHDNIRLVVRLLLTPIVLMVANPEMTLLILLLIPVCWIVRSRVQGVGDRVQYRTQSTVDRG